MALLYNIDQRLSWTCQMLAWSRMWAGFNLEGFWGEASHQKISRLPEIFVKHTVLGMFLPSLASQTYFCKRKGLVNCIYKPCPTEMRLARWRTQISKNTPYGVAGCAMWLSLFRKWVWVARLVFTFRIAISEDLIFPEKHAQTSQEYTSYSFHSNSKS